MKRTFDLTPQERLIYARELVENCHDINSGMDNILQLYFFHKTGLTPDEYLKKYGKNYEV